MSAIGIAMMVGTQGAAQDVARDPDPTDWPPSAEAVTSACAVQDARLIARINDLWPADRWALAQVCTGEVADFSVFGANDEPLDQRRNRLSPDFLPAAIDAAPAHALIRIQHATFVEVEEECSPPRDGCSVAREIDLANRFIRQRIILDTVELRSALQLTGTHLQQGLGIVNSDLYSPIWGPDLVSDRSVRIVDTNAGCKLDFGHARVASDLEFNGVQLTAGACHNPSPADGAIILTDAVIDGDLSFRCIQARISGPSNYNDFVAIDAQGARVALDVFLDRIFMQRAVVLSSARIEGALRLTSPRPDGCQIKSNLWGADSVLALDFADVGRVHADFASFNRDGVALGPFSEKDREHLVSVGLSGFRYGAFPWLSGGDYDEVHAVLTSGSEETWPATLETAGNHLDATGRPLRARRFLLDAARLEASAHPPQFGYRSGAALLRYQPWTLFWVVLTVIGMGWICYLNAPRDAGLKDLSALDRFWFSLNATVPIVKLDDHFGERALTGWISQVVVVQQVLGAAAFALALAAVAILIF